MTTSTPGISAVQLQRQLGLSRYQSAWAMLHKLRRATVNPERPLLTGEIEVDECEVGGVERAGAAGAAELPKQPMLLSPLRSEARAPGAFACKSSRMRQDQLWTTNQLSKKPGV